MENDQGRWKDYPVKYASYRTVASNGGNNVVRIGPGFLQKIIISQDDAAPTAGIITIYDNTTIYGTVATKMFSHNQTTGVFMPMTVQLDMPFYTGLTLGFTTTADVNVIVVYKSEA